MGASRHTQRHQEQAHRRITRDDPHPSVPASGWKPAGIKYERSGLTYDDIAALLDGTIAREKALEAERDRLRAALDVIASHLKSRREFHAKELKDSRAWTVCDDFLTLLSHYGIVEKDHRAGHRFGGDQ